MVSPDEQPLIALGMRCFFVYESQFSPRHAIAALPLGFIFNVDSFEVYLRAVSARNPANSARRQANTEAFAGKRLILCRLTSIGDVCAPLIKVNRKNHGARRCDIINVF